MNQIQGEDSTAGFDLSQFHEVFFEEAAENLANMETLLLALDVNSADDESLNAIFRCAHSIKGGSATFGFQDVADLTHEMETLLDRLRRHELTATPGMVDTLLESGDVLRQLLARHRSKQGEVVDCSELVARIGALASGVAAAAPRLPEPPGRKDATADGIPAFAGSVPADGGRPLMVRIGPLDDPQRAAALFTLFAEIPGLGSIERVDGCAAEGAGFHLFRVNTESSDEDLKDLFSFHVAREQVSIEPLQATATSAPVSIEHAPGPRVASASTTASLPSGTRGTISKGGDFGFFDDALGFKDAGPDHAAAPPPPAPSAALASDPGRTTAAASARAPDGGAVEGASRAGAQARTSRGPERPAAGGLESSTIRVPIEKVDQLINLVGELVIIQAMLAQTGRGLDPVIHQAMATGLGDLERNTRLLQESVMAIRMIPMAVVFNRFPRMLRDLAARLGKQVELHTVGEDTELDKGLIEKITDPLTHLVRNAADHGIESPADRVTAGKPAQGTITLSAAHQGGSIVIEVRDDGRGLDRAKLLHKALERGLPAHAGMTDQEVYGLIFEPGFSTAAAVTDVSGRGVGMDVVKRNISALGGSVEIDSAPGRGMRVSVRLPLTLAIMDGMSVGVAEETYIVPIASVVESIHLSEDEVKSIGGSGRVVEVRDEYLPLVSLDVMFDVPRSTASSGGIMIVVEAEGSRIALVVDELIGQHQVVVKNLESNYRKVPGVSGATILGDGRVALILDVAWLVRRARH